MSVERCHHPERTERCRGECGVVCARSYVLLITIVLDGTILILAWLEHLIDVDLALWCCVGYWFALLLCSVGQFLRALVLPTRWRVFVYVTCCSLFM